MPMPLNVMSFILPSGPGICIFPVSTFSTTPRDTSRCQPVCFAALFADCLDSCTVHRVPKFDGVIPRAGQIGEALMIFT